MKKLAKLSVLMLVAVLLLTACGETDAKKKNDKDDDSPAPSINYEDYIDPVVDRNVAELITETELSDLMDVEVTAIISTDSVVTYQSENGYYTVTLAMENQTRAEFDTMVEDTAIWTFAAGVGEVAYWGTDQTELVAYQGGYAVSVSGYHVIPGCIESIMLRVLNNL